jgi:hypothetical protein
MPKHYYKFISVVTAWWEKLQKVIYLSRTSLSLSLSHARTRARTHTQCKRRWFQLCGTSYKKPVLSIRYCSRWGKNYTNERQYATPTGDRQQKINHIHNMSNYYHMKLK